MFLYVASESVSPCILSAYTMTVRSRYCSSYESRSRRSRRPPWASNWRQIDTWLSVWISDGESIPTGHFQNLPAVITVSRSTIEPRSKKLFRKSNFSLFDWTTRVTTSMYVVILFLATLLPNLHKPLMNVSNPQKDVVSEHIHSCNLQNTFFSALSRIHQLHCTSIRSQLFCL